jgi:hypothetical protein
MDRPGKYIIENTSRGRNERDIRNLSERPKKRGSYDIFIVSNDISRYKPKRL